MTGLLLEFAFIGVLQLCATNSLIQVDMCFVSTAKRENKQPCVSEGASREYGHASYSLGAMSKEGAYMSSLSIWK